MADFVGHTPIAEPENDYQGPVAGLSTEGDSWKAAVQKINRQFKELFERTEHGAADIIASLHARIEDLEARLTAAINSKVDKIPSEQIRPAAPQAPDTPVVAEPAPAPTPAPAPAAQAEPITGATS